MFFKRLGLVCLLFAGSSVVGFAGMGLLFGADLPPGWTATPPVTVSVPATAYVAPHLAASAAAAAEKPAAATRGFKRALGDAATTAFREGKISRWQLARVRMAIAFRADAMAEAQACVIDQAVQDGLMRDAGPAQLDGFDWSGLLAFLKELLPLILQIISVMG